LWISYQGFEHSQGKKEIAVAVATILTMVDVAIIIEKTT
jgi:hypothetical protein